MPPSRRSAVFWRAWYGVVMLILGAFGTLSSRRADGISDDAKRKYVEGVRFVGDGECELAVKKLRDAILSDGKEGARKFRGTGVNYEDYFPHYYLGTCLEKLGQNGEALRELQESDRQGAVKRRADLNRSLSASLQRLASAVPPPTPVVIAQLKPTAVPTAPSPAPTSAGSAPSARAGCGPG